MEKKILKLIKKFDNIIIARHVGCDPDALGSTFALKSIILYNFPNKKVKVCGAPVAKFKSFGEHDIIEEEDYKDALLIALDVPDIKRIDGVDIKRVSKVIKIDHHPAIDIFGDIEYIDILSTSASQIVAELCYKMNLKMTKKAAENIYLGIVADTNRFLFPTINYKVFELVAKLTKDFDIDIQELYESLYKRPMKDVRLEGYISQHMSVSKHRVGHIFIEDKILKEFKVDSASVGNIMNNYNYIKDLTIWVLFTEDVKQSVIRVSARSNGPTINKLFEQYNGGGHKLACGAKITSKEEIEEILTKLEKLSNEYHNEMEEQEVE